MPLGLGLVCLAGLLAIACDSTVDPVIQQADRTPPVVSQTSPTTDAQGVPVDTTITVTFSERMNAATVHPGTYRVSVFGQPLGGIVVGDGDARHFVFVPSAPLPGNRWIEVELREVADLAGNPIASAYQFSFHTFGDDPLPPRTPRNPYPGDGAVDVPSDTVFTWEGGSDSGEAVTYDFWLGSDLGNLRIRARNLTDTQYRPGPLPYETAHVWRIVARSVGGEASGPLWSFTTADNPDPSNSPPFEPCGPSPVDGELAAPVDASLSWACIGDPDGDTLSFEVYLGTSPDPDLVATVSGPPYIPSVPLSPGTDYHWRIIARDGRGGATASPLWGFHTETPPPPNEPPTPPDEPITPPDRGTSEDVDVELTWSGGDDPDKDPVTYLVRFGTESTPPDFTTVGVKSLLIEGLDYDTRYYWQIVAQDDHDHEVAGPRWRFRTPEEPPPPNEPPDAPRDPDPANGSEVPIEVTLSWNGGDDPDGDDVVYVVFLEEDDLADPDSVATVTAKSYSTTLGYPGTYFWRIEARDDRGGVGASQIWFFTTNGPPTAPCNPSPADGAEDVPTIVVLRWGCGDDPEGRQVQFDVHIGTTPDPPRIGTVNNRAYGIGLDFDTTYYWRIVARDDLGGRGEGPTWSFTTRKDDGSLR